LIKVVGILRNVIGSGGGFDQALNAILQMRRLSNGRFEFEVYTTVEANVSFLNRLGVSATVVRISIIDKLLAKLAQNGVWQSLQVRLKWIGPLEKKLIRQGCDVVYLVTPDDLSAGLQKLNYITTIWDLCHRETPEFPEVRDFNTFSVREKNYKHNLGAALLTLTESNRLADMASQFYGIERSRFLAMPLTPMPFLKEELAIKKEDVRRKHALETDYFYYPAQFWAHKNHIRILQALVELRQAHAWMPNVVFSGKDHGNLEHIVTFIHTHNLQSQVRVLGFVPSEDMRGLYENALAVVMPTYFGPTNLPPLEAWSLGIPLIYSVHLSEQTGDAALLVDPDSATELADAMLMCTKSDVRKELVLAGHQRLADISQQRVVAEIALCVVLERFAARRQCWA
jgi:glycosyltransferase involved in cell wall biosynthesis